MNGAVLLFDFQNLRRTIRNDLKNNKKKLEKLGKKLERITKFGHLGKKRTEFENCCVFLGN